MIAEARVELALAAARGSSSPPRGAWPGLRPDRGLPLPPGRPWQASHLAPDLSERALPRFLVRKLRAACNRLLPARPAHDPFPPELAVSRLRALLLEHLAPDVAEPLAALAATALQDLGRAAGAPPEVRTVRAVIERVRRWPMELTVRPHVVPPPAAAPSRPMPRPLALALAAALESFAALSGEPDDARDPLLDRTLPALREVLRRHLDREPSSNKEAL